MMAGLIVFLWTALRHPGEVTYRLQRVYIGRDMRVVEKDQALLR